MASKLHIIEASAPEQFDLAFEAAAKAGDQALPLLSSPLPQSVQLRADRVIE